MTAPTLNTERDYALIERISQQDHRAFNALYNHYSRAFYGVLIRIVKDEEVAADLLQETFLRVWNGASSYDPGKGRVFSWIYKIAQNQAITWLRSEKRQPTNRHIDLANHAALYLVDSEYAVLPHYQDYAEILALINTLPDRQRQVVQRVCVEGHSYAQVAESMKLPMGTVSGWLYQARKKIQKSYNLLFHHV